MNATKNYCYESAAEVEQSFYKAFGDGDLLLMKSLFAEEGTIFSHSDAALVSGFKNSVKHWTVILDDIPQKTVVYDVLNITRSKNIEVHLVKETVVVDEYLGKIAEVIATNVYVLQDNGWRLQMQRSSPPELKIMTSKRKMPLPINDINDSIVTSKLH